MSSGSPSSVWKGKSKATDEDFDDLNPIITYRHLYSHALGVKDPLRVIALCDSDAFYAACEQVRLGIDRDRPLVVLQWEALIAVNYPARKFGISRMDKLKDAKQRCPELVVVHVATYKEGETEPGYWDNVDTRTHKVSLDYYRRESMKIITMFKDGLPGIEVEKASIDEAFYDFTQPVREVMLQRYPYLAQVPPDAPNGMDSPLPPPPPISWDDQSTIISITPASEKTPLHAGCEDDDGEWDQYTTWHDVALSIGAELMAKIREDVHVKLGYTTSAGIARNKFLAKLSASYKKPMGQSILRNAAIPNFLRPMPFQKIRFLGGKLGDAIAKEYDVSTVGDLLSISLEEIQRKFGENAIWVWEVLRGIDRSEVKEKSILNKSMLASKNLPTPITKASDGHHWIRVLAAELALRLIDARKTSPTLWPKTIVLHARQGYETGRSKQTPFPFCRDVTVDLIAGFGDRLWKELVGVDSEVMKVTIVQLSLAGLETAETGQKKIEGFLKPSFKRTRDENDGTPLPRNERQEDSSNSPISFICHRCGKHISLPRLSTGGGVEEARALTAMRIEHDDFHFAQDLAKTPDDNQIGQVKQPLKKKRQKEPEGIAKFFTQKR